MNNPLSIVSEQLLSPGGLDLDQLQGILGELAGPRRAVAMKNAQLVFPRKTAAECRKLVEESYDSMIWTGVEALAMQRDPSLVEKWALGRFLGNQNYSGNSKFKCPNLR